MTLWRNTKTPDGGASHDQTSGMEKNDVVQNIRADAMWGHERSLKRFAGRKDLLLCPDLHLGMIRRSFSQASLSADLPPALPGRSHSVPGNSFLMRLVVVLEYPHWRTGNAATRVLGCKGKHPQTG